MRARATIWLPNTQNKFNCTIALSDLPLGEVNLKKKIRVNMTCQSDRNVRISPALFLRPSLLNTHPNIPNWSSTQR